MEVGIRAKDIRSERGVGGAIVAARLSAHDSNSDQHHLRFPRQFLWDMGAHMIRRHCLVLMGAHPVVVFMLFVVIYTGCLSLSLFLFLFPLPYTY